MSSSWFRCCCLSTIHSFNFCIGLSIDWHILSFVNGTTWCPNKRDRKKNNKAIQLYGTIFVLLKRRNCSWAHRCQNWFKYRRNVNQACTVHTFAEREREPFIHPPLHTRSVYACKSDEIFSHFRISLAIHPRAMASRVDRTWLCFQRIPHNIWTIRTVSMSNVWMWKKKRRNSMLNFC